MLATVKSLPEVQNLLSLTKSSLILLVSSALLGAKISLDHKKLGDNSFFWSQLHKF